MTNIFFIVLISILVLVTQTVTWTMVIVSGGVLALGNLINRPLLLVLKYLNTKITPLNEVKTT
jgi:hypothetical protein